MGSTAVQARTGAEVDTGPISAQVLERIVQLVADAPRSDGDLGGLLARIMDCETLDEIATIYNGLDNSRDVAGIPLMIHSFVIHESTIEDSTAALPFYATVYATNRNTGDDVVFNSGASTVLVSLLTGHKRGWFPFTAHIEMKDVGGGKTAANLVFDN